MGSGKKISDETKRLPAKERCGKTVRLTILIVGCLLLFVFFQFFYRYHLYHREQFSLFLTAPDVLQAYWKAPAAISCLVGDFLTQFFYFRYMGPIIMALTHTLLGVLVYRLFFRYLRRWALVPALCAVLMETGRQCGLTYPLSSTWQWIGLVATLLLCRWVLLHWKGSFLRYVVAVILLGGGVWLFGWGDWEKRSVFMPNMTQERMLAVDTEYYFGRYEEMGRLLDSYADTPNRFDAYYRNLWLANQYRLSDDMLDYYQPFELGLFLPVDEKVSYPIVYASGELWFLLGDMTNAEHSTMLGMIFSPKGKGVRPLRRLAEINLINGDDEAAMKYLRILEKTLVYRRWARARMPGQQTPEVQRWLTMKRSLIASTDLVRAPLDLRRSLVHLLHDNPDNVFARQYLLAFDLMHKDVGVFVQDYTHYSPRQESHRLWEEALLIWISANGGAEEEIARWNISPSTVAAFREYNTLYKEGEGAIRRLQQKYGKTYWFFFHFASMDAHE
ncbi:MAG: hypothetical protein IK000_06550 [Bacteroidaceae bacterium]|nr:hypothetical protein [Bacteroidaceae bacterium]